jgi:hypothetical protein
MRPFAPCFAKSVASPRVYLLRRAKQRKGTMDKSSGTGWDIVKNDEDTSFLGVCGVTVFVRGG